MDKLVKPSRLAALVCVLVLLVTVYIVSLYKLQIVEGAEYYEQSQNTVSTTDTVVAARGNILDRYGRVMVSNRVCNNLLIDTDELFDQHDPNAILLKLAKEVEDSGNTYTDTMPITKEPPFEYVKNMTDIQREGLNGYLTANDLPETTTAVELMAFFREKFEIDNNYSSEEMRTIAGIRYEIKIRYLNNIKTSPYIFAENVSIDLITKLMENDIPGFKVKSSYIREYNTDYAAHILGYIGMIPVEDADDYKSKGYPYDSLVGRAGAEKAFESYLHGTDGTAVVTSTKGGTVIGTKYTTDPNPGNHVYTTIDLGLQEATEISLNNFINTTNEQRQIDNDKYTAEGKTDKVKGLITGGGVVAVKVKTGEPLCVASAPTFDLKTLLDNFTELQNDDTGKLLNRALMGAYAPGSTFKPVTALASLNEGIVSTGTSITCEGIYTKYQEPEDGGFAPKCWIYPDTHGPMNTATAIANSCNYYFYTVGETLGIDRLYRYAHQFGLGEPTGIELDETNGQMASKELKKEVETKNKDWFPGDTLTASIGQSYSLFTPLQLANYCAALANNGKRYEASILKSVRSYDYSESVYQRKNVLAGDLQINQEYYDAVHTGMYNVVHQISGNTKDVFTGFPVSVAAKTGTSQLGEGITNNGVFICYAPYEDPEIALAIVIEKGYAGSDMAGIARDVLDYYFSFKNSSVTLETENSLLK